MNAGNSIKHLFTIDDIVPDEMVTILDIAESFRTAKTATSYLSGKIAGLCFFQQSTRTYIGFSAAMNLLGGSTWSVGDQRAVPRAPFGETVEDTVRVVSAYCHVIVLRHAEIDTFERAMHASVVPVINAGSGTLHHPTQTLIDLFQIRRRLGQLAGLRIGVVGDLPSSRAARSLLRALRHWPPSELRLMVPPGRGFTLEDLDGLDTSTISTFNHINIEGLDVLYVSGLPNPKGEAPYSYEIRRNLTVSADTLREMPEHCILMCPLPRIDEIDKAVDSSANAAYFQQSDDGLWVRMAVLQRVLSLKW